MGCPKLKCLVEVGVQGSLGKLWGFYGALNVQWGFDKFCLTVMDRVSLLSFRRREGRSWCSVTLPPSLPLQKSGLFLKAMNRAPIQRAPKGAWTRRGATKAGQAAPVWETSEGVGGRETQNLLASSGFQLATRVTTGHQADDSRHPKWPV